MLLDSNASFDLVKWVADRFSIIGWSALVALTWKVSTWFNDATKRSAVATDQVNKLATEHFPAIKDSLAKQDGYLKSMDDNLRVMAQAYQPPQFEYYAVPATPRSKRAAVRKIQRGV
jgi:hypothetical protein